MNNVKIWDIGIRVFHWALVLMIPAIWLLAEQDEVISDWARAVGIDLDPMRWHARLGYLVAGLLVFRLLWGIFGSDTARFSQFLKSPKTVIVYLSKQLRPIESHMPHIGHNPAGGWMVFALLLLMVVQVVTGLFNVDDVDFEGPLYAFASDGVNKLMHELHEINFDLLLIAIAIHISAIVFYAVVKKDRLVPAMVSGSRMLATDVEPRMVSAWRMLACALVGGACAWILWMG